MNVLSPKELNKIKSMLQQSVTEISDKYIDLTIFCFKIKFHSFKISQLKYNFKSFGFWGSENILKTLIFWNFLRIYHSKEGFFYLNHLFKSLDSDF